jgi:hypothetical protein
MKKDKIVNQVLDPRKTNLGSLGVALVAAAKNDGRS